MLGVVILATTTLLQNLAIIILSTEFLAFTILLTTFASRFSYKILSPFSRFAKHTTIGKRIFKTLASISVSPWKWWYAGKATEAIGQIITETNITIASFNTTSIGTVVTTTGASASIPASFLISCKASQYKLFWQSYSSFTFQTPFRIIPKAIQGSLLTFNPFTIAQQLYMQNNPTNHVLNALYKTRRFGIRDALEFGLDQTVLPNFKTTNKCTALLLTEFSITKTTKVVIREYYEQIMSKQWEQSFGNLEIQAAFMISNFAYAFSLDPVFEFLKQKEDSIIQEYLENGLDNIIKTSSTCEILQTEQEAISIEFMTTNLSYTCICNALTGYDTCKPNDII